MKNNGTQNDNPFSKANLSFDFINNNFTCPYGQKLLPTNTKMINRILNNEYATDKCPKSHIKSNALKNKYLKLYEPISLAFLEGKRIFQSTYEKKLYKLRPVFSE